MPYLSSIVEVNLKKENKIHVTKQNQSTISIDTKNYPAPFMIKM